MAKSTNPGKQARGIAAYRKILGPEKKAENAAVNGAAQKDAGTESPVPSGGPGEEQRGFIKTLKETGPDKKARGSRTSASSGAVAPPRTSLPSSSGAAAPFRPVVPPRDAGAPDSKYRRVAKLLILIGSAEGARILSHLDRDQVEKISAEIASIKGITAEEADAVLYEFKDLVSSASGYSGAARGGVDAARSILHEAFGGEKGEALLRKAVPEAMENPFSFLEEFSGEQIALLLRNESPAAAALVLSRISPKSSAAALANTSPDKKYEIIKRIARLGETSPEVLENVGAALREKARALGSRTESDEIDGRSALAAILRQGDFHFGDRILEALEEEDPELAQDMKGRFHTLDDVVRAEDKPLQAKLRSMSDKDLAVLLKGKGEAFAAKILSNLSSSRRELVRDEGEILGAVPKRDVDTITDEFLAWFRLNREEGKILLLDDDNIIV
jgi:flagellar motor switch protein FliG